MEVLPGGKYEPLTKYAKIFFERCDELPTIGPLDNHNLQSVLRSLVPEPGPELEVESKQESESKSESENELEVESESENESENELEIESENELEVESESELEIESESELEVESESELEIESESELEAESKPQIHNTTFKNRPGKLAHRYSIKNRKSISLKIEGGLLSSLTSAPA
jgi:hypothetical protein